MENVKVIFDVKNGVHVNRDNQTNKCLICTLIVQVLDDKGNEMQPICEEWKDFRQKALDFRKELNASMIEKTDLGVKIQGFSIPWNIQYLFTQLIEQGYLK